MGGMNYHVEIQFEDGICWLARIRRLNVTSPPQALQNFIMRSEVATLEFLRETNIPAPEVFDFCLSHPTSTLIPISGSNVDVIPTLSAIALHIKFESPQSFQLIAIDGRGRPSAIDSICVSCIGWFRWFRFMGQCEDHESKPSSARWQKKYIRR
jgi:hypothetical protein